LVEAARRILLSKGYEKMTLDAIEAESGLNKSLVAYYFGGKAGLIEALVEGLFPDLEKSGDSLEALAPGEERVMALLELQRRISADDDNQVWYELLPHVVREKKLRTRFAAAYRAHRRMDASCIASGVAGMDPAQAERLAVLSVAVLEGLAVQRQLDPKGVDYDVAFSEWEAMVIAHLRQIGSGAAQP
jgi:AcrR family transcriptional regulator